METKDPNSSGAIGGNSNGGGQIDLSALKRGRGRPPGSGNKAKQDSHPPKSPSGGAPLSDVDATFLSESCVLLLETGDEIIAKSLANKLAEVCPERGGDFMRLHSQVGMNDKDRAMLRTSIAALVRKYAVLGRFGPEILLFVFVIQYSLRQVKLAKFVQGAIDDKQRENKTPKVVAKVNGETPADIGSRFPGPIGAT